LHVKIVLDFAVRQAYNTSIHWRNSMKFYTFHQNNSGGGIDDSYGLGWTVVIEAEDADSANAKAEAVGIYFNGCEEDESGYSMDCPCCGDRWYPAWEYEEEHQAFEFETGMWVHFDLHSDLGLAEMLTEARAKELNEMFDFPICGR